ncbi:Receptor protein kinase [Spatholobus suberectus]|nr:Receptor protein kinase [Spatholobus suberectus]
MQLTCQDNITYITIKDVRYQVLEANQTEHTLKITRMDYLQGLCPSKLVNTGLDNELFVYGSDYKNLSLFYGCALSNSWSPTNRSLPCNEASGEYVYPQFGSLLPPVLCKASVVVPVPPSLIDNDINDFNKIYTAIRDGFVVRWIGGIEECMKCEKSGGVCGFDCYSNQTTCYCRDGPCSNLSSPPGTSKFIDN